MWIETTAKFPPSSSAIIERVKITHGESQVFSQLMNAEIVGGTEGKGSAVRAYVLISLGRVWFFHN